ncbi:MAG: sugar ABC transporter permease [Acholeplasmatales bacterium]|nr:sugar ABC transporter permease [Acholeplasmatales bacterium]
MQKIVEPDQTVVDEVERTKWKRTLQTLAKDWRLYVLLVPMLVFLICFKYIPIFGIAQGFKWGDYSDLYKGQWCGFYWMGQVLAGGESVVFWRAFRNTFVNSMYGLVFGFPIPILLALMFSEVKNRFYLSFLQVASYLPHFISTVVLTLIIRAWCDYANNFGGMLFQLFDALNWNKYDNGEKFYESILIQPKFFRPIYQISGIWEGAGYGSIVYFAAILAISPTSYEAARIDGASKLQQIRYVTFPGMAPTLTIMLITRIGHILNVGYEKIILLYGDKADSYETSEVISTYVYKVTGCGGDLGISADNPVAMIGIIMDLFNSIIAMVLVLGANAISRRVSNTSLF